jgi:hypothetical protein
VDLVYRVRAAELFEVRNFVDILAGNRRRRAGIRDLFQQVGVVPGNNVFDPFQVELLVSLAQLDEHLSPSSSALLKQPRTRRVGKEKDTAPPRLA